MAFETKAFETKNMNYAIIVLQERLREELIFFNELRSYSIIPHSRRAESVVKAYNNAEKRIDDLERAIALLAEKLENENHYI